MGRDDTIAAMADEILTSVADGIATVTMNRPERRTAMNGALLSGILALNSSLMTIDEMAAAILDVVRP